MVNTVILAVVTLASLFNVVWGTASENSVNLEISGQTNGTDLMPEDDFGFDYGNEDDGFNYKNSNAERKKCPASKKCTDAGGSCIKSRSNCDGTVNTRHCKGKKCKCCIPARSTTACPTVPQCATCPTVPQCPTCPTVPQCPTCPTVPQYATISTTACPICPTCPTVPPYTTISTTSCPTCPAVPQCTTISTTACPICPTCPAVPQCTTITTQSTTTTPDNTNATGIAGFEFIRGKVIRRTKKSDAKGNYTSGMSFCNQFGATPFIPQTSADYDLYRDVRTALGTGGWMWLPADDRQEEGNLRWFDGVSVTNTSLWDWRFNQALILNNDTLDCVFYGYSGSKPDTHMWTCGSVAYPPICHLVPAGFESFGGRVIRRTTTSDPRGSYTSGISFCKGLGAEPFVPATSADYDLYRDVVTALGSTMWIPADDRQEEGRLRWYNNALASNTSLFDWYNNQTMFWNHASKDCVLYGWCSDRPCVYMGYCTYTDYPPICEII